MDYFRPGETGTRHAVSAVDVAYSNKARQQPGVYALNSEAFGTGNQEDDNKLSQIKEICLHNANVCDRLGEPGKQGVWKLLAQMVDRRLNERPDSFNGWGGRGGGALGVDLVGNIMRYYERLGDVQMLATMVCVLSGGRRRNKKDAKAHLFLLPRGHDEKYDAYIRRYADLLYGWGLLVKRAELNKHLVQHVRQNEGLETPLHPHGTMIKSRSSGIAFVFTCSQCGRDAEFGTNVCRSCQDYAFKCSICETGVRGLFTVCDACGHGGHVNHITTWFEKHSECPAGCGCNCIFTAATQQQQSAPPRASDALTQGPHIPYIDQLDPLINANQDVMYTGKLINNKREFGSYRFYREVRKQYKGLQVSLKSFPSRRK
jgi:hypothetical protein